MNLAILPIKKDSERCPNKNFREINGKPLFHYVTEAALNCDRIDKLVISTDKQDLKYQEHPKLEIFTKRKPETCLGSSESVIEDYILQSGITHYKNLVLLQATNPFLNSEDLTNAFVIKEKYQCDTVLSCVRQKRFLWNEFNLEAFPMNYHFTKRPRMQDFSGFLVENGAFYLTDFQMFLDSRCRINGKILVYEMNELSYFEIDTEQDFAICEKLLELKHNGSTEKPTKRNRKN